MELTARSVHALSPAIMCRLPPTGLLHYDSLCSCPAHHGPFERGGAVASGPDGQTSIAGAFHHFCTAGDIPSVLLAAMRGGAFLPGGEPGPRPRAQPASAGRPVAAYCTTWSPRLPHFRS